MYNMTTIFSQVGQYFPEFEKYLNNTDAKESVTKMLHKKSKPFISFIKQAAKNSDWHNNKTALELVTCAVKVAQSKKSKKKKFKAALQKIKKIAVLPENIQPVKSTLHIAEIVDMKKKEVVARIVAEWHKTAKVKKTFSKILKVDKSINKSLDDSADVCRQLKKLVLNMFKGKKVYVAYDNKNRLQGVAMMYHEKQSITMTFLATAPHNIQLLSNEKSIRGVGTSLFLRIGTEMIESNSTRIKIESYLSARGFYKSLGFVQTGKNDGELTPMELSRDTMIALLKSRKNDAIREDQEPVLADSIAA